MAIDTGSVVFLAAENAALPGGKVGGVGDVVGDLPKALADEGWRVSVATPSYGALHRLPGTTKVALIDVPFRGETLGVEIWHLPDDGSGVDNVVLHHHLFASQGSGRIYVGDDPARPFAADADKFALYCAAAAEWIFCSERLPDVVHLHDWHAAFYLLLTHYDPRYRHLDEVRTVFTIHNLSYQGIRPLADDDSSLAAWFPGLSVDEDAVRDPRYDDCLNPMATAIRLADAVSTVSPTYAGEICRPSNPDTGFIGGEGLETDLVAARDEGRLFGVLNGCYYDKPPGSRPGWQRLKQMIETQLSNWRRAEPLDESHEIALLRLIRFPNRRPPHVLTSVGRLVAQKASLLLGDAGDGRSALQQISANIGKKGAIIVLGSGDPVFEARMLAQVKATDNVLFLRGYSEALAAPLYAAGDLFLMPSSFEPCGISQMLSMRAGQPCVVHGVGGLRDTVKHNVTGFVFDGATPREQSRRFVETTLAALELRSGDPIHWQEICRDAAQQRFDWRSSARQTIKNLYGENHDS